MNANADVREAIPPVQELSLLSLKAAMQIDAIRRKEVVQTDYVGQLVENLRSHGGGVPTAETVKEFAPPTVSVMRRAITAFSGNQPHSNEDLAVGITDLFAKLNTPLEKAPDEDLLRLLNFCVTLHDELLLQKRFVESSRRPKSKYRV